MSTQKSIIVGPDATPKIVTDRLLPTTRDDCLLVHVKAVSLNPADWKSPALNPPSTGSGLGCDFAGIVKAIPDGKAQKTYKIGDRICGFSHGANKSRKEDGAFAEQVVVPSGVTLKIPETLSFAAASTLSVGIISCAQGLYKFLKLPLPSNPSTAGTPVLIYGGSAASGSLAIQFAKLSGLTVITTCSPKNFDLAKSRGADFVFDYKSPTVVESIRSAAKNNLQHVFNCIGDIPSAKICYASMKLTGGRYCTLLMQSVETDNKNIETSIVNAYDSCNEAYSKFGIDFPQDTETYKFVSDFMALSEKLLSDGKLQPHPAVIRSGGFEGILEGLKELESGVVSGQKLVYAI